LHVLKEQEHRINDANDDEIINILIREIYKQRINQDEGMKINDAIEILKYFDKVSLILKINQFEMPKFELNQNDILNHKFCLNNIENQMISVDEHVKGSFFRIKYLRNKLIKIWIDSHFTLTKDELLKIINKDFLSEYIIKKKK
jgi:hypothetical protein